MQSKHYLSKFPFADKYLYMQSKHYLSMFSFADKYTYKYSKIHISLSFFFFKIPNQCVQIISIFSRAVFKIFDSYLYNIFMVSMYSIYNQILQYLIFILVTLCKDIIILVIYKPNKYTQKLHITLFGNSPSYYLFIWSCDQKKQIWSCMLHKSVDIKFFQCEFLNNKYY